MDLSPAGLYVFPERCIELFFTQQFFEGKVHPVSPIMMWVGGDIDALVVRVLPPELVAHPHDILELKHAPLCRGMQMLKNDGPIDPWLAE